MLPNMPRSKLRLYTIFLVAGVFLAGAAPYAARAQSGDALAHAERTCLDHGIGPNSVTFDTCTERAASAYDQGAPGLAVEDAHRVAEAQQACMSYDLDPQTLGYHQCVARQADRAPSTTIRALRY
ncbi:MAG TPA: hypothetical protein VGJ56_09115 [Reyranella sp.]|jgi:hypothetical protein